MKTKEDIDDTNINDQSKKKQRLEEIKKFAKNFLWILVNIIPFASTGLVITITGITLDLLGEKMNVNETYTLWLLNFRGFGKLFGSLFAGPLYRLLIFEEGSKNQETFYKLSVNKIGFLGTVSTAAVLMIVPFTSIFWVSCILHFLIGALSVLVEILGTYLTSLLFEKGWQKQAIMNIMFVSYGVVCSVYPSFASLIFSWVDNSMRQLELLYVISGVLTLISGFFLPLVKSPLKKKKVDNSVKKINEEKTEKESDQKEKIPKKKNFQKATSDFFIGTIKSFFSFNTVLIIFATISRSLIMGRQGIITGLMVRYGTKLGYYSIEVLPLFTSIFYITITVSRTLFVFISIKVNALVQIVGLLFITLGFEIFWIIVYRYSWAAWVVVPTLGFVCGPMSSSNYIMFTMLFDMELTPGLISFMMLGQNLGYIVAPYIAGSVMEDNFLGPIGLIVSLLVNDVVAIIFIAFLFLLGGTYQLIKRRRKNKIFNIQEEKENNIELEDLKGKEINKATEVKEVTEDKEDKEIKKVTEVTEVTEVTKVTELNKEMNDEEQNEEKEQKKDVEEEEEQSEEEEEQSEEEEEEEKSEEDNEKNEKEEENDKEEKNEEEHKEEEENDNEEVEKEEENDNEEVEKEEESDNEEQSEEEENEEKGEHNEGKSEEEEEEQQSEEEQTEEQSEEEEEQSEGEEEKSEEEEEQSEEEEEKSEEEEEQSEEEEEKSEEEEEKEEEEKSDKENNDIEE